MYRISVDTGGTFTDVVVTNENEEFFVGKSLTDYSRVINSIRGGLDNVAEIIGITREQLLEQSELFIFGTTRATNAVVTRNTAKTALVCTRGFPDLLTFRQGGRSNPHDFVTDFPDPYIPRRLTWELEERIAYDGKVVSSLNEDSLRQIVEQLKVNHVEAVAVSLLWSIVNPVHELAVANALKAALPDVAVTLSHQLLPVIREYPRTSACAIDASLKPLMQKYLADMEADLRELGYSGQILVSTSIGGCMEVAEIAQAPIYMLKSGPSMAPVAAREYAMLECNSDNALVCDTGGTTFDVGLVRDGELVKNRETWLGERYTGELLGMSTVDVRSVGAGGGSIAWMDGGGLLRIGPQSAGSEPGPACYGRGGDKPTVTDAAVVCGFLDPNYFANGKMTLDVEASHRVIDRLAEEAGKTVAETAIAILKLSNEKMIGAIADITISEGLDPRESTFIGGGGAAGLNILPIARELGCSQVILPKTAGALSACGMQFTDLRDEHSVSAVTNSGDFDFDAVARAENIINESLNTFADKLMGGDGVGAGGSKMVEYTVEARYETQIWEISVPVGQSGLPKTEQQVTELVEAFHRAHERIYSVRDPNSTVEFVYWKGEVAIDISRENIPANTDKSEQFVAEPSQTRSAFFGGDGFVDTGIYMEEVLKPGAIIKGPAIIQEPTTTIVVYPGMRALISDNGNYICETGV